MQLLHAAAQFKPEVVLLDPGLPGMDGFQLAHEMRKLDSTAGALLVAVTGYGLAGGRQRSLEAGFDYHLLKPAAVEEIHSVIESRLPKVSSVSASGLPDA